MVGSMVGRVLKDSSNPEAGKSISRQHSYEKKKETFVQEKKGAPSKD